MYQLIDQHIVRLSPGSRLVLWAMRGWVRALAARQCPPGAIAPGFVHCHAIDALPAFHRLMTLLNSHALDMVRVAELAHPRIVEGEALVLRLWTDARHDPANARATLLLLLEEEMVEPAFEALISASVRLTQSGLPPDGLLETSFESSTRS